MREATCTVKITYHIGERNLPLASGLRMLKDETPPLDRFYANSV